MIGIRSQATALIVLVSKQHLVQPSINVSEAHGERSPSNLVLIIVIIGLTTSKDVLELVLHDREFLRIIHGTTGDVIIHIQDTGNPPVVSPHFSRYHVDLESCKDRGDF